MDSVALNGDSADVDKADSVDWFIASIPTGSSPASLRVGDYEQEIARPAT